MRIRVAMTLLVGAAACSPPPDRCGEEICTKEQRCTPEMKCVTDGRPTLTIETPLDMAAIAADVIEVRGVAKDDEKPPIVDLSTGQNTINVTLNADGSFAVMVPIPKIDGSIGQLIGRARDSKLQEAKVSRTLNVDNVAPACRFDPPVPGTTNSTTTLPISMRASDGSLTLGNPQLSLDGAVTFITPPGTNGVYDYSWPLPVENGGSHELVFRVQDISGNTCEVRTIVVVDNVKPTVSFAMPAPGTLLGVPFFTAGGRFGGAASDGARLLKSVTMDFADSGGARPATITGNTWSVMVPAPAGDDYKVHTATVVATDFGDNTASATLSVTVDVKAPVLTITNPAPGAKLNVTHFPAGNNAPLTWTLTDGDPQLNLGLVLTDGGFVSPPVLPTSATDNPKTYSPLLRANDRAGNTSTATVTFTVDRVLPTVTGFTPANNTRMHPGIVTGDFSEPMMGGAGLSTNPQVAGGWVTPQRFEISGFAKDSVYTVTTGAFSEDLHSNPVVPVNFRFHTETVVPVGGALLGTGYNQVFGAAADAEGVLNVLARLNINSSVDWIQFNSRTGVGAVIDNFPTLSVGNLVAARTIQADLSSRRLAGTWFDSAGTNTVRFNVNGAAPLTIAGGWAFIPTAAFPGEGAGLAEFGAIVGGVYRRTGRADLPLNIGSVASIAATDTRWEVVANNAGGTQSQSFGCPSGCSLTALKTLGGGGAGIPNSASTRSCSIHGYLNGATELTTIFKFQPGCGGSCAADITEANNFDQVTADPMNDGTVYGFNAIGGGQYQIRRRVLSSASCTGAITDVGLPISLGAVLGQPRIVVLRGTVGLIYADASNQLRFITP